jgi:hypothetical protein
MVQIAMDGLIVVQNFNIPEEKVTVIAGDG